MLMCGWFLMFQRRLMVPLSSGSSSARTASPSKVKGLHSVQTLGTAQRATQNHIPEDLNCFSTFNMLHTFCNDQLGFVT